MYVQPTKQRWIDINILIDISSPIMNQVQSQNMHIIPTYILSDVMNTIHNNELTTQEKKDCFNLLLIEVPRASNYIIENRFEKGCIKGKIQQLYNEYHSSDTPLSRHIELDNIHEPGYKG